MTPATAELIRDWGVRFAIVYLIASTVLGGWLCWRFGRGGRGGR